jgi:son of sevenless
MPAEAFQRAKKELLASSSAAASHAQRVAAAQKSDENLDEDGKSCNALVSTSSVRRKNARPVSDGDGNDDAIGVDDDAAAVVGGESGALLRGGRSGSAVAISNRVKQPRARMGTASSAARAGNAPPRFVERKKSRWRKTVSFGALSLNNALEEEEAAYAAELKELKQLAKQRKKEAKRSEKKGDGGGGPSGSVGSLELPTSFDEVAVAIRAEAAASKDDGNSDGSGGEGEAARETTLKKMKQMEKQSSKMIAVPSKTPRGLKLTSLIIHKQHDVGAEDREATTALLCAVHPQARDMMGVRIERNIVMHVSSGGKLVVIKMATLSKLVALLTHPTVQPGATMLDTLALTFPLHSGGNALIELLEARIIWAQLDATALTDAQRDTVTIKALRIVELLLDAAPQLFWSSESLYERTRHFVERLKAGAGAARRLQSAIAMSLVNVHERTTRSRPRPDVATSAPPPTPLLPVNLSGELSLLSCHPEELARQLTLIDAELFARIEPREWLHQAWNGERRHESTERGGAPNIAASIDRFNAVSQWVGTLVLQQPRVVDRQIMVTRLIDVADECRRLQNFNALMAIVCSLSMASVDRLKRTWAGIGTKPTKRIAELSSLMSMEHNYSRYRQQLHASRPPMVPYLGVMLSDVTFILDGNKDGKRGYINYEKYEMLAKIVRTSLTIQTTPYSLVEVAFIQDFLRNVDLYDDERLYAESLVHEPRADFVGGGGGSLEMPSTARGLPSPSSPSSAATSRTHAASSSSARGAKVKGAIASSASLSTLSTIAHTASSPPPPTTALVSASDEPLVSSRKTRSRSPGNQKRRKKRRPHANTLGGSRPSSGITPRSSSPPPSSSASAKRSRDTSALQLPIDERETRRRGGSEVIQGSPRFIPTSPRGDTGHDSDELPIRRSSTTPGSLYQSASAGGNLNV